MADTFTELVARVRSMVPDVDGDFVTATDIGNWINESYFDLADRLDVITQEFTGTTSGDTIALPPSGATTVKRVASLRIDDADVTFVDDATFNAYVDSEADPDFTIAREFDGSIELFPEPDSGLDYALRCYIVPGTLSGSDEHELPMWTERKMVDYAVYRAMQKGGELSRADSFLATYEQGLPEPSMGKDRSIPGPITLAPIVSPFDLDPEARHI